MKLTKGKIIAIWIGVVALLLTGGLAAFCFCYKVERCTDGFVLELGEELTNDPFQYVSGMEWSVPRSRIDFSEVEEDKVGQYQVYLKHGWQEFAYTVTIRDTTPPELALWEKDFVLQQGRVYDLDFFLEKVFDLSGDVEVVMLSPQNTAKRDKQLTYGENGSYDLVFTATDPSGNYTSSTTRVLVDTPPEIKGMQEHYLAVGCEAEFLTGIEAVDERDGDVSASLTVDVSKLNPQEAGDYLVTYQATDCFGFIGESTAKVHVLDAIDLQEKISTHEIDRFTYNIVGAFNLYDAGYYEEDDVEFIQDTLEVCVVRLSRPGKSYGSGFIIRITPEEVIICTNQHVTHSDKTMEVYFHDGSRYTAELIAKDYDRDMAFLKVPATEIEAELFDTLRSVHIDEGYWKNLSDTEAISLCIRTINESGSIWRDREGILLNKKDTPEANYRSLDIMTRMQLNVFAGSSGSAVFDGHGRLIGMVTMRVSRAGTYISFWAITLEDILDFYEETFGEAANYH